jgi:tellurite resistance-related uncharacterized protein
MKSIPEGMRPYKRTAVFTQDSIPAGLRRSHTTKPGVWGKIVVLSGELQYTILGDAPEAWVLSPERPGIVEETVLHEVAPLGPVEFYVEFYARPAPPEPPREHGEG